MKKIIYTLFTILLCSNFLFGQNPTGFNYQTTIYDTEGQIIENTPLTLTFSIVQNSILGNVVYEEEHQLTTNFLGEINVNIGQNPISFSGDFNQIKWGNYDYFLIVKNNQDILRSSKIASLTSASRVLIADSVNRLDYNQLYNVQDITNWDEDASDDFDGDYNSLIGGITAPTITEQQANKIDSILITKEIHFDTITKIMDSNNKVIGSPGFGHSIGLMVEGNTAWHEINNTMYYTEGAVGINLKNIKDVNDSVSLHINGGIQYTSIPSDTVPGTIFYRGDTLDGVFCYYDKNKELVVLSTGNIDPGLTYDTEGNTYLGSDMNVAKHLVFGKNVPDGFEAKNTVTNVDYVIRWLFDDTSSSSSFPNNDWEMTMNDGDVLGGDNYFAITNKSSTKIPFYIDANASNNLVYIANGNVGIDNVLPSEKVDINGNIKANQFLGNASRLTNLNGTASGSIENIGSTTIISDSDNNQKGAFVFETSNIDRMLISNNGNLGIDTMSLNYSLLVNGNLKAQNVITDTLKSLAVTNSVFIDPLQSNSFNYEIDNDIKVIFFNPNSTNISINFNVYTNLEIGSFFTVINTSETNTVSILGLQSIVDLGQNQSVTLIKTTNNNLYVLELVN